MSTDGMPILIAVVGGFGVGVFVRSLTGGDAAAVFFVLSAGVFGVFYYFKKHVFYTFAIAVCLCASLGAVRLALSESPLPEVFLAEVGERVQYEGVVVADPDVRDATQRVQIKITKGDVATRALAVAPRHPGVAVGDRVRVSGTLNIPEAFADDNGRIFRYDKYLERDGVRFMLDFASLRVEGSASWYSLPTALAHVKHLFLDGIAVALPEPHASLAGGIVVGGKSGLGTELKDAFTRSGLVHIVVLSGHNVMIVASWVITFFIFAFARVETVFGRRVPRGTSIAAGAFALILFVGIAGLSATSVRAALMALIALYARATGRTYAAGRALLVVILLMLLWNPLYLVFDPGFGLSVAATAGLIWLAPLIETFLRERRWLYSLRVMPSAAKRNALKNVASERPSLLLSAVATALAAQVGVLPLLLYQTGNLSLVAIPANVVAALIVPIAMAFSYLAGFGGMLFGFFSPLLAIMFGIPAYLASAALIFLAEASAGLPFAAVTLPPFPFWLVIATYAALIAVVKRFSTTDQFTFAKKASI